MKLSRGFVYLVGLSIVALGAVLVAIVGLDSLGWPSSAVSLVGASLCVLSPIVVGVILARLETRTKRPRGVPGGDAVRLLAQMRGLSKPTLLLTPTLSPGFSKLGGLPELPPWVEWPRGERAPRTFVAQVDFAEIAACAPMDWLPPAGRLFLFLDERRGGCADQGLTVFTKDDEPRAPRTGSPTQVFGERRVAFLRINSSPSLDWLDVDVAEIAVSDAELDQLAGLPDEPFGDEIQHRIGGYPSEIQRGQMQVTCERLSRGMNPSDSSEPQEAFRQASLEWRMLMQIDADPALGMTWGDSGRLYVFVRKCDAASGDFSRTVTLCQTH